MLVAALTAVFSCEKEKSPQGIMTKSQMAEWMMTMYVAEARLLTVPMARDSAYKIFIPYQDSILKQKSLQDSTLKKSYQYYLDRPAELEAVYDLLIDSLSLREQRLLQAPVH
jgi:hypothetical protein